MELESDLNGRMLAAFRHCLSPSERLYALDWQHPGYWFDPHGAFDPSDPDGWKVPVFPAGDYYIEISAPDFNVFAQAVKASANMQPLAVTLTVKTVETVIDVATNTNEVGVDPDSSLTTDVIAGDALLDLPDNEEDLLAYLQELAAAIAPLGMLTGYVGSAGVSIALLAMMAFICYTWFINTAALMSDVFPERVVGSVLGLSAGVGQFGGILMAWLAGYLLQRGLGLPATLAREHVDSVQLGRCGRHFRAACECPGGCQ